MSGMRVAVIDIGSNSIRLLVAEVGGAGAVEELERDSRVTRLARGVDADGLLAADGIEASEQVIEQYVRRLEAREPERVVAIATSAVRDAANGTEFLAGIADRLGIETRLLDGETEARLSYGGAVAGRAGEEPTLVFDIGGGSTELIAGEGERVLAHDSLQLGVVRHSERHIASDPPRQEEIEALAADATTLVDRSSVAGFEAANGIGLAGTATSLAAIDLDLEAYDPARVHGHRLTVRQIEAILDELAAIPEAERRRVPGLHPDRAPTIVAGIVITLRVMERFGLEWIEVSEHDILWGAALEAATRKG